MILTNKSKITVLEPYMEVVGLLVELEEQDGVLLAEIAQHVVVLPIELKDALLSHLEHKIAVLRTNIPGKEYLLRILPGVSTKVQMADQNLCASEQIQDRCEASS